MSNDLYRAVIGVRLRNPELFSVKYRICTVPNGKSLNAGDVVYIGGDDPSKYEKGICVSDTLFVDERTLDLLRIFASPESDTFEVKGVVRVDWYDTSNKKEVDQ